MADDTGKENLDDPANNQSENSSEEIDLTKDTEAISRNQKRENMEVHKHPHHVTHKKKWNEYLLEFFMLFLAVFLGFLAENQREHIVEHKRENKFAARLLSDLKEDSSFLNKRIKSLEGEKIKYKDFLSVMTSSLKDTPVNIMSTFYGLLKRYTPQFTTATYNQMKASGSLRYINDDSLTTALQKYYEIIIPKASIDAVGTDKVFMDHIVPFMIKHFRFQYIPDSTTTVTEEESEILNRTAETDQELINIMGAYHGACTGLFHQQKPALEACEKLIDMIKKEYHLE